MGPCVGVARRSAVVTLDGQSGAGTWWPAGLGVAHWRTTVFFEAGRPLWGHLASKTAGGGGRSAGGGGGWAGLAGVVGVGLVDVVGGFGAFVSVVAGATAGAVVKTLLGVPQGQTAVSIPFRGLQGSRDTCPEASFITWR